MKMAGEDGAPELVTQVDNYPRGSGAQRLRAQRKLMADKSQSGAETTYCNRGKRKGFLGAINESCAVYEARNTTRLRRWRWLYFLSEPSIRASVMFTLAARAKRSYPLWQNLLLILHSSHMGRGVALGGPLWLPHPIGVVIGSGVTLGSGVTIFQNVTLGTDGTGKYPDVGDNAIIFSGAVVAGDVTIEPRARIRALSLVIPATSS